jgi:2-dehydro-3-deoxy-D-arabinonate dehydratase
VTNSLARTRLLRARDGSGRIHVGVVHDSEFHVLATADVVTVLESAELPAVLDRVAILDEQTCELAAPWTLLCPLVAPEVWAAGVTYERSRAARMHESEQADVYDLVYEAERPELFLKDAAGRRTVGPGEQIATRTDATWTVPEPELAVVLGSGGTPLAVTIGDDVSARDIEGANPLYLPQAKVYARACALGPALLVPEDWSEPFAIELRIFDSHGELLFSGETSTSNMRRSLGELIGFLRRDNEVAAGTVLLTGTGVVPPDEVGLAAGYSVEIHIPGVGTLRNTVAGVTEREEPEAVRADA